MKKNISLIPSKEALIKYPVNVVEYDDFDLVLEEVKTGRRHFFLDTAGEGLWYKGFLNKEDLIKEEMLNSV